MDVCVPEDEGGLLGEAIVKSRGPKGSEEIGGGWGDPWVMVVMEEEGGQLGR